MAILQTDMKSPTVMSPEFRSRTSCPSLPPISNFVGQKGPNQISWVIFFCCSECRSPTMTRARLWTGASPSQFHRREPWKGGPTKPTHSDYDRSNGHIVRIRFVCQFVHSSPSLQHLFIQSNVSPVSRAGSHTKTHFSKGPCPLQLNTGRLFRNKGHVAAKL